MDPGRKRGPPNPRETANFLSSLFFWWTLDIFREGYQKDLTVDDLYEPLQTDKSQALGDELEKIWNQEITKKNPYLLCAIIKTFWWSYLKLGVLLFINIIMVRQLQPIVLGSLLEYFTPGSTMLKKTAALYAAAIVLLTSSNVLSYYHYTHGAFLAGMRVRAACCSLIYRKSLRLSHTALGQTTAGQVVNLLSNDVSRFDMVSVFLHYIWMSPIMSIFCAYFLYMEIGVSGFVGIGIVFTVVPIQAYTAKLTSKYRLSTAYKTDERVRLTEEIISGIKVIKMYAWEKPFTKMVEMARKLELDIVLKTSYIRAIYMSFSLCTTQIALFCTLITFVLLGNPLNTKKVFVVLSYFNLLSQTISTMFVRGIVEVLETLVSIKRLQNFMMHEELEYTKSSASPNTNGVMRISKKEDIAVISLDAVTARWTEGHSDNTLQGVNLRVRKGQLVIIVGHVGAGKSSLLQAILGELPVKSGTCKIKGKLSYSCQDPWAFASTIRRNILFGHSHDRCRYREVLRVCALQRDLELFPQGDLTVVGDRGAMLSGGQKARINLARAIYHEADVYLLDDPLSAVDTQEGKHLFEECMLTFLKNKTRILVTHQLQYVSQADHLVVLNNGKVEIQGTYTAVIRHPANITLLGITEAEEENQPQNVLRQVYRLSTQSKSTSDDETEDGDSKPDIKEITSKGNFRISPLIDYFQSGTNVFVLFTLFILFIFVQSLVSGADYFVAFWTNQEELRNSHLHTNGSFNYTSISNSDSDIYNTTELPEIHKHILDTHMCMYIYCGIVLLMVLKAFMRSFFFYKLCNWSSGKLHNRMFQNIIRTPMLFFNTNPAGSIINRFSKDFGSVDELLPKAILDSFQINLKMLGCLIVAFTVNWMYVLPALCMCILFWFMRKIYLRVSKTLKRLEGMTKSPVFSHLLATLQGLTTVRAYGAQNILTEEFDKHQDLHTSSWYMTIACAQAFGFSLDLFCLIYIAFITFSFLFLEEGIFGAQMGLAITQSMAITAMLQWGMRQSAEVENQLMSVERILEYTNLEGEPLLESTADKKTPSNWPSKGEIEFSKTFMKYKINGVPVLIDLNGLIKPSEKVGIVGRTGAGKSSLIAALFRLAYVKGTVKIDGVDTANVCLEDLRSRISIIPQDPVLFSGTLRFNLDPFKDFSDSELWKVLDEVELREALSDTPGLDMRVANQGNNFSVGQRQLVCLARAILRNNRILLLDEATANVDPQTDALIQKTIRLKFKMCTVLTVAHRLNTIMDSDKVIVMESGRIVEFEHPHLLLQNKDGHFSKMVNHTGQAMAQQLQIIAEESYKMKHGN